MENHTPSLYTSINSLGFKGCFKCGSKEHWNCCDCPLGNTNDKNTLDKFFREMRIYRPKFRQRENDRLVRLLINFSFITSMWFTHVWDWRYYAIHSNTGLTWIYNLPKYGTDANIPFTWIWDWQKYAINLLMGLWSGTSWYLTPTIWIIFYHRINITNDYMVKVHSHLGHHDSLLNILSTVET